MRQVVLQPSLAAGWLIMIFYPGTSSDISMNATKPYLYHMIKIWGDIFFYTATLNIISIARLPPFAHHQKN